MDEKTPNRGTPAFIDTGYPPGADFCTEFLDSKEFLASTLKKIAGESRRKKREIASQLAADICADTEESKLLANSVLTELVTQPRQFLAIKFGKPMIQMDALAQHEPSELLRSFGKHEWYGPVVVEQDGFIKRYLIRTYSIPHRINDSDFNKPYGNIRWHVIAEIADSYIALSWSGFMSTGHKDLPTLNRFEYWKYIPVVWNEIEKIVGGVWHRCDLYKLILNDVWNKYTSDSGYRWQDRRINSDLDGVWLSAHALADEEENNDDEHDRLSAGMQGLRALSMRLGEAAVSAVSKQLGNKQSKKQLLDPVELEIRRSLIHSTGTKSYEFSIKKRHKTKIDKFDTETKQASRIFRAHCFFGNSVTGSAYNQSSLLAFHSRGYIHDATEDSLEHFKCFRDYGNSTGTLAFIVAHRADERKT
jgi:hypothetical protein